MRGAFRRLAARRDRTSEAARTGFEATTNDALGHFNHFRNTGDLDSLDLAVAKFRRAIADAGESDERITGMANLGLALRERFTYAGRDVDLDEALAIQREVVNSVAADDPERLDHLANLAASLHSRYARTKADDHLTDAIEALRAVVASTPREHPRYARHLSNLGIALKDLFGRTRVDGDLEEALAVHSAAVESVPEDHPERAQYLSNLAASLLVRALQKEVQSDLDQTVAAYREAAAAAPEGTGAGTLMGLGIALQERFERAGADTDLREAIDVMRRAVTSTWDSDPTRVARLAEFGRVLLAGVERFGEHLDEVIDVLRDLTATAPPDDPERAEYLSHLGMAAGTRFELTGALSDLAESISALQAAAAHVPSDHPGRAAYLANLGNVLAKRVDITDVAADRDEAIAVLREAVAALPVGDPRRPTALGGLGMALKADSATHDVPSNDLDEAILVLREAARALTQEHKRWMFLNNLGIALLDRYERTDTSADLDDAIATLEAASAAVTADHPRRADVLVNLGMALRTRFDAFGREEDRDEALALWRTVSGVSTLPAGVRALSARRWGELALRTGAAEDALPGYVMAVDLLPRVAWRGLTRADQEHLLVRWYGLGSEAAACAVQAGHAKQAVELLEQSRSILWSQTLETRTDLSALRDADPVLADRLDDIRAALDGRPGYGATARPDAMKVGPDLTAKIRDGDNERLRILSRQWDEAVDQVRKLPDLGGFLRPPSFAELRQAAADGPVVVINVSDNRCDGLVVTPDGVRVVPLPDLTFTEALERARAFVDATAGLQLGNHTIASVMALQQKMQATMEWLWDTVANPILDALGIRHAPSPGEPWPRIWWCPTGPLTLLPLHAACPREPLHGRVDSVLDRVVSSYTPTLRALTEARRRPPAEAAVQRMLMVAIPHAPGQPPLKAVSVEARALMRRFRGTKLTPLWGRNAARANVLSHLPRHAWVHFACHGKQDLLHPAQSAVYLHDGPLSLLDIAAEHLEQGELAYLSACETGVGGFNLPDEALHLAAGLQLAGYRHVIATLWSIHDRSAPKIADRVYATLARDGVLDLGRTAEALHHAVRDLRNEEPAWPMMWAPYFHIGP